MQSEMTALQFSPFSFSCYMILKIPVPSELYLVTISVLSNTGHKIYRKQRKQKQSSWQSHDNDYSLVPVVKKKALVVKNEATSPIDFTGFISYRAVFMSRVLAD